MRQILLLLFLTFSTAANAAQLEQPTAIFAGGCFWSMEGAFEDVPGVISVVSGYTGGTIPNPTYKEVSAGNTGHVEAIKITFDPNKIGFEDLLPIYWRNVDPFNEKGQFCDSGPEYRSQIFFFTDAQRGAAEDSLAHVTKLLGKSPVTKILPAADFYPAEDYHQDYKKKNPEAYKRYRTGCGRTTEKIWGKTTY